MNQNEVSKLREKLFSDMINSKSKLKKIYEEKKEIPMPSELFENPSYEIVYFDLKLSEIKSIFISKKEIENWIPIAIKIKRYFLGNFSYALVHDNKESIIFDLLTDFFNQKCIDLTDIVLFNSSNIKSLENKDMIIRFCIFKANTN
jgi:hypothetical protein